MILLLFFLIFLIIGLGVFYYYYDSNINTKKHLNNLLQNPPVLGKMVAVIIDGTNSQPPCLNTNGLACGLVAGTPTSSQQAILQNNINIDWQNSLAILDYETKIYNDYVALYDTANINIMKIKITALVNYMTQHGYTNSDGTPVGIPI